MDDEAGVRFGLREYLEANGFDVDEADTCVVGEERFKASRPDAVVLDYALPDGDALQLMQRLRAIDPATPFIILTAHGSIELAVRAIKEGAEQFLTKPVELSALLVMLRRVLESRRDRRTRMARTARDARSDTSPFIGSSAAIRRLAEDAEQVARAESALLIQGETGAGKGVLARWLHSHGPRADEAMVDLNCAGLNREFLESELFGHEKGAFTGASQSKTGLLDIAHRGTVFLDEIGDLHPEVQPKLLKVLEEKRYRRMGDVRERTVDIRLLAATHRDLLRLSRERGFRSDLYFRISTFVLKVPSLAERPEDIAPLAESILQQLATDVGRARASLSPAAARVFERHQWPGNIRELRNVLERAVLFSRSSSIEPADLRFDAGPGLQEVRVDTTLTLEDLERRHIEKVLLEEAWHVGRTAERLGVPRSTLYQKLSRYGLRTADRPRT